MNKSISPICIFFCLASLIAVPSVQSQSIGAIYINADGSVSGTDKILQEDNFYRLTSNLDTPIIVLRNDIVLDGAGFALQGAGGWGIPGAPGVTMGPAVNLTCTNVTVHNFNITGWETGILGVYNENTIYNNTVTASSRAIAVYASNYNIKGNYLSNSIYGLRIKGDNNNVTQNQLVNNFGGLMMSYSTNTVIVANKFMNNNTEINVDNSTFTIYRNNFYLANSYNTSVVSATIDAVGFNVGIVPTWDNGAVGNYWSDYNGADQNGDGIGDSPYIIRAAPPVIDHYPLMAPVNISDITLPTSSPSATTTPSQTPTSFASPTATSSPMASPLPISSTIPTSTVPEITPIAVLVLAAAVCLVILVLRKKGIS